MEMSTKYSYKPLRPREIRLFELWPGSGTQPLKGQLIHHPRGDTASAAAWFREKFPGASYEALSYTWGDSIKTAKIKLYPSREATISGDMGITDNLAAALRRLRLSDRERFLWIDAICINQEDLAEREKQVVMMRNIFEGATQTIIWLGEEDTVDSQSDTTTATRSALRCIGALQRPPAGYPSSADEKSDVRALSRLLSRQSFSRVWVYQEVMVSEAETMMCGAEIISWDKLHKACLAVRDHEPFTPQF
ncbi:heterokaryon incompatibility protein-domain-containing protein [Podospora didyma]|uniref:Heterokaryon incompatibility protein-domain-containing protein n=1 Tax=Podospora didyma TaxID=330526 RepID=A0AAE0NR35_9PEZI|nr:heterokaryon incompatibility protein-domain-containing protein [Podospora didyma]